MNDESINAAAAYARRMGYAPKVSHCVHRDIFGCCAHPNAAAQFQCSGIRDDVPEEDDTRTGDEIPDGNCCCFFDDGVKE